MRSEPHIVSDCSVQGLARGNRYHDAGSEKVLAPSLMRSDVKICDGWRDVGPRIAKGKGRELSERVRRELRCPDTLGMNDQRAFSRTSGRKAVGVSSAP